MPIKTAGEVKNEQKGVPDSWKPEESKKTLDSKESMSKNIRAPIGEEPDINKLSQEDKIRMATGRQARLDLSFYNRLPEYQDMTLFWENDTDGAVEKWLHLGACLIPRKSKSLTHYKGFTGRAESEWECVPVGSNDSGQTIMCYALGLPEDEYYALRIQPKEDRNKDILKALGIGKAQVDSKVMPQVSGIKTYAPNNPVGTGQGFEQMHDA